MDEVREPTFLVLAALADERRHGYGIIREVARISKGATTLRAGTLYAILDRLTADGLIEVDREEVVEGRLRRYYALTAQGSSVLAEAARHRAATSKEAMRRLRLSGGVT